jgi:hypothetical protein
MSRQSKLASFKVEQWNGAHRVGVLVRYHPVIGRPEYRVRKTVSPAEVLWGHTAVVWLDGERGCVAVEACEAVSGDTT